MTPEDKNLELFPDSFVLEHMERKSTCFEGLPSYIDLIITNRKAYFKKSMYIRISHFHKLTVVSIKS